MSRPIEFSTLETFRELLIDPPRLILPGLGIEEYGFVGLCGQRKTGKTSIANGLAIAFALGEVFADVLEVPNESLVFYSDDEQHRFGAARRWTRLGVEAALATGRLNIALRQQLRVDSHDGMQRIVRELSPIRERKEHRDLPAVFIIDSKAKLFALEEENSNSETELCCSRVLQMRDELRCTIIALAHYSPNNTNERKTTRGATSFEDNLDLKISVQRDGDVTTLKPDLARWEEEMACEASVRLTIQHTADESKILGLGAPEPHKAELAVAEAAVSCGGERKAIVKLLKSKMATRAVDSHLKALRERGYFDSHRGFYIRTDKVLPGLNGAR